jgi:hypothetical protein
MRFSEGELALIKATFADNDTLLKKIRKAFFQFHLTDEDAKILGVLNSAELHAILRKVFLPEIDADAPLGQNIDLFMTINVQGKDPIDVSYELEGRTKVIKMIEEGLTRLQTLHKVGTGVIATHTPMLIRACADQDMVNVTARNTLIMHIEQQLIQLKVLAGQKEETVEETKTRLMKDSTR